MHCIQHFRWNVSLKLWSTTRTFKVWLKSADRSYSFSFLSLHEFFWFVVMLVLWSGPEQNSNCWSRIKWLIVKNRFSHRKRYTVPLNWVNNSILISLFKLFNGKKLFRLNFDYYYKIILRQNCAHKIHIAEFCRVTPKHRITFYC